MEIKHSIAVKYTNEHILKKKRLMTEIFYSCSIEHFFPSKYDLRSSCSQMFYFYSISI